MKSSPEQIRDFLTTNGDLLVVIHFSPDGDAVGSLLAFGAMLDQLGVGYVLAVDDIVPERYSFLPGFEKIRNLSELPLNKVFDRVVVLDAGALPRIGSAQACIGKKTKILNIDHHFTGPYYGSINHVNVKACATAEILFDLCIQLELEINQQIAYGLYVGILTDTGRFSFSNTGPRALEICADLIRRGVDPSRITDNVYHNQSFESVKALSSALSTLELHKDGLICLLSLDRDHDTNDTEGFVEHALSIKGVVLAAFLREMHEELYKVSLRSRCQVDVSEVAAKFGGGGHLKAAGFRFTGMKNDLVDGLIEEFERQLELHNIHTGNGSDDQ
ncbi:MAG TPA: bifunctional oligoribonuclease/PAP phosphatase NrnA [Bacteroidetes bacterium]|nr:bifunctional oligoribonuclease/PAP phosphatase NrnA [Bacteroidota bacterium]